MEQQPLRSALEAIVIIGKPPGTFDEASDKLRRVVFDSLGEAVVIAEHALYGKDENDPAITTRV